MDCPVVSIYTITRNRCDLLPRAMKSVLNQTYKNIEYIIIDSASTDDTEKVVKLFDDERIRYVKLDKNETFGFCVNMAIHMATGKYVSELDDDDEYHLDKIEKQVNLFETLPEDYGMVYCWMTYYDNNTREVLRELKSKYRGNVIDKILDKPRVSGTPTLLFKKEVFDLVGGYKEAEEIGIESDFEFAARICKHYKVDYVAESLVNVFINHSHLRMSDPQYYKESQRANVKFERYFINEFKDVFDNHPKMLYPHLYALCYTLSTLKDNSFWKEYLKLFKIGFFKLKVIALPFRYLFL